MKVDLFCKTRNHNFKCKIRAFWSPNLLGTLVGNFTTTYIMARNLAHQTLCDLHSCCHAVVRSRWFYSEFWAHNVWNVQVVKYLVVWGQTKATDPKILPKREMAMKNIWNKLLNKRFWRKFGWFLAKILWKEGLWLQPCSRHAFTNRINNKFLKHRKEEYAFPEDKKLTKER